MRHRVKLLALNRHRIDVILPPFVSQVSFYVENVSTEVLSQKLSQSLSMIIMPI